MGKIEISETQFAFAFFHKYLLLHKDEDITFLFPTLHQEGDKKFEFAGADLVVSENLIFQFKMTELLRTRNAVELAKRKIEDIQPPYFRMWIKNSPSSQQFDLLKIAASKGYKVQYVAPLFDYRPLDNDDDAFINFFDSTPVDSMNYVCSIDFEQFINPTEKSLSADNKHKICYSRESVLNRHTGYIFSKSQEIRIIKGVKEFDKQTLIFKDNPKDYEAIDKTIQEITSLFKLEDLSNTNVSIEDVQMSLITKHNIFWLPVLRSRSKRRKRVIRTIISED